MINVNIAVDLGQLRYKANQMNDLISDYEYKVNFFKNCISTIKANWHDNVADSYVKNMEGKYIIALQKMSDDIERFSDYLNQVVNAYSAFEECYCNKKII